MSFVIENVFDKYTDPGTLSRIVDYPNMTRMWRSCCSQYPDSPAVDDGRPYSFSELDRLASGIRNILSEAGIGKGSKVGIFIPNSVQFIYSSLDSGERIVYRVSEKFSPELLNGDYNKYAVNRTLMINGRSILVKGNGDGYKTAEWAQGTLNLCILSDTPLTEEELKNMIR